MGVSGKLRGLLMRATQLAADVVLDGVGLWDGLLMRARRLQRSRWLVRRLGRRLDMVGSRRFHFESGVRSVRGW